MRKKVSLGIVFVLFPLFMFNLIDFSRETDIWFIFSHGRYILSNGFQEVQLRKLRSSGIEHYIHHLVLSDDCGITKPLPGIFEYALKRTGAIAETTVMIGDNYDADVQGAKNAGWHTILFNIKNFDSNNVPDADVVVETLEEIKSIL